mmetsp:Transcript_27510/g.77824  ORF Transcript_27510/g.77824 Transcript_27510/m.77824 type:complete len:143 (+) Transcript_27510:495-923(+)
MRRLSGGSSQWHLVESHARREETAWHMPEAERRLTFPPLASALAALEVLLTLVRGGAASHTSSAAGSGLVSLSCCGTDEEAASVLLADAAPRRFHAARDAARDVMPDVGDTSSSLPQTCAGGCGHLREEEGRLMDDEQPLVG